ncbi:hypothetical protein [Paractinoplanes deccanensis]|uniref:hypothetical protein n=1 Tax=Paractinoplanes deccanensis TaxID=113561 RepID=UPI001943BB8B|nr:hypothetical protein [Actinoplanes deccanensis]
MAVTANLDALLDEPFRSLDLRELVAAPVSALSGVSEEEAQGLALAFGINTIGDLAENQFIRAAVAINALAKVTDPPA